jgi:ATP-binding cassette subfamily F protein uup
MNYLQVENITKSFGDLVLFDNISISIHKDQKVALIAKNGAGKTTLLNIIAGIDSPDDGKVTFRNDIKVGYLEQMPYIDDKLTVMEHVFNSSKEIVAVIKDYEKALENDNKNQLEELLIKMDVLKAWDYEVKVNQILSKFKITNHDQIIGELSGGQKKRLALASILILEPDLLILDEPTNHLDLEMIEWLEVFLKKSKCTLLMVTHDRYFLDRVCTNIIEMDDNTIYNYKGNYTYFLEKREERILNQTAEVDKAKNLLKTEQDWMRRMPQARGTKAKYRIDAFYDLKDKASQKRDDSKVKLDVQTARLGKKIVEISNLSKSYGDLKLIENFSYKFQRFEKVGIVGKNGTGKSTLLNLINNTIQPDSGSIEIGETVVFGYYKQDGIQFDEGKKVLEVVQDIAEVVTLGDGFKMSVSHFLNYFLFPPEVQHSYVSKLSGGELRRLYLCTVLMKNPNFLILDEPTNDLDILTLDILEDYLKSFTGCVLIVSHDRYFMDKIVDHLFVFEGEGVVKDFPGNYSIYRDYEIKKEKKERKEIQAEKPVKQKSVNKEKSKKLSYKVGD